MRHGGDLTGAREEGVKGPLIDFSSNINPLGMPSPILDQLKAHLEEDLRVYPDPLCRALRRRLGAWLGCDPQELLCGCGVSHLLQALLPTLPEPVALPVPSFVDYERSLEGKKVTYLTLKAQEGFHLTASHCAQLKRCRSLVLGNPNNPTGLFYEPEQLEGMLGPWLEEGGLLVVDESFLGLTASRQSFAPLAKKRGWKVLTFNSLTKAFALPGLRLGWAQGEAPWLKSLSERLFDWSVSGSALRVADALHELEDYQRATAHWLANEGPAQRSRLLSLGLTPHPTDTNFYLLTLPTAKEAQRLADGLQERGMLVRRCHNFRGLDGRSLRFALKDTSANEALCHALKELCHVHPSRPTAQ